MSEKIDLFEYINDLRKENKMESDLLHKRISDMKDELMEQMKSMRQEQQECYRIRILNFSWNELDKNTHLV